MDDFDLFLEENSFLSRNTSLIQEYRKMFFLKPKYKVGDKLIIKNQLTFDAPKGTEVIIVNIIERNTGLWYRGGRYDYIINKGGHYYENDLESK